MADQTAYPAVGTAAPARPPHLSLRRWPQNARNGHHKPPLECKDPAETAADARER